MARKLRCRCAVAPEGSGPCGGSRPRASVSCFPRATHLLSTLGKLLCPSSRFPAFPPAGALEGMGDVKMPALASQLPAPEEPPRQHRSWSRCSQPQLEHPVFKMYLAQLCYILLFFFFYGRCPIFCLIPLSESRGAVSTLSLTTMGDPAAYREPG